MTGTDVDPRLRQAVDVSLAWYADVFSLHGIPTTGTRALWRALADPPRYHSTVKTLQPGVPVDDVLAAAAAIDGGSVADSFGDLVLPGVRLLFEAQWLHHPGGSADTLPTGWSVVSDAETLARWCRLHDYVGVLPDAVLAHDRFTVLGRFTGRDLGADLVGGAVLHHGGAATGLSNTWSAPGHPLDWDELLRAACAVHPDRALTGYAAGDELGSMLHAGFASLGPQRVWLP